MIRIGRKQLSPKKFLLIVMDMVIAIFAMWVAVFLFHDGTFKMMIPRLLVYALTFAGSGFILFTAFGFYSQMWRFASIRQYMLLCGGSLAQTSVMYAYMKLRSEAFPWQTYVIYFMITFILTAGVRVAYRLMIGSDRLINAINDKIALFKGSQHLRANTLTGGIVTNATDFGSEGAMRPARRRVLVIGAGMAGSQMIRDMQQHNDRYEPVALIDDNPLTHTYKVMGVPVFGGRETIPDAVRLYRVDTILLAIPSAPRKTIREFIDICSNTGCEMKTVPSIQDLINNRVHMTDIKDIDIGDLIGHEPVQMDNLSIARYLNDQVVLVIGGGGLIGSELCRQIAGFGPRQLVIFDIHENNAYQLLYELRGKLYEFEIVVMIGSVADAERLQEVFDRYRPNVVFHAAAHKQAALLEQSPEQAFKTNVVGTFHVCQAALSSGVRRLVLISSDRAEQVNDIFGLSMRLAERIVQIIGNTCPDNRFAAVRFGDIIDSRVGVVSTIRRQIRNRRKVLIASPDLPRSFLKSEDAIKLILQVGAMMDNQAYIGHIFQLEMGEPMRLADLARDLIRLSNMEPDVDIKVEMAGSNDPKDSPAGLEKNNGQIKGQQSEPSHYLPTNQPKIKIQDHVEAPYLTKEEMVIFEKYTATNEPHVIALRNWYTQQSKGGTP